MKRLLTLFFILFNFTAVAQYPTTTTVGSNNTTYLIKGVAAGDVGLVIKTGFSDTATVNSSTTLDNYAGVMVRTGSTIWVRNSTATAWNKVAFESAGPSGSGIYLSGAGATYYIKGDSTLSDGSIVYGYNGGFESNQQTISPAGGNNNSVLINPYRFQSLNQYDSAVTVATSLISNEADSMWYRLMIEGKVPGRTQGFVLLQSDSLNRLATIGMNPSADSTVGYQLMFTTTGAILGYRSAGYQYDAGNTNLKGLKVDNTTKVSVTGSAGFVPTKLTTAQRTAIVAPEEGVMIYDTDLHKLYVWDGTTWQGAW